FLDEIGDTPFNIQTKILRFLQEGVIEKLGENVSKKLDVRVLSATNKDIARMTDEASFRQDLLYRLNAVNIHLPPLRKRKEDLKDLLFYFVRLYSEKLKIKIRCIDNAIPDLLETYDWPGNIRELQNVISAAVMLSSSGYLNKENIKIESIAQTFERVDQELNLFDYFSSRFSSNILEKSIELVEKELLHKILDKNRFHLSRSAEDLGISRVTLNAKIKKYQIEKES
ncbi:MAG: sigma-54-dependent Fis family transcriptional regulator, partial [SAR324 cluster bacterium]|nr:sigma-54-dependent Fis family transcriptional regulator [SAR324 cluster bacterium]